MCNRFKLNIYCHTRFLTIINSSTIDFRFIAFIYSASFVMLFKTFLFSIFFFEKLLLISHYKSSDYVVLFTFLFIITRDMHGWNFSGEFLLNIWIFVTFWVVILACENSQKFPRKHHINFLYRSRELNIKCSLIQICILFISSFFRSKHQAKANNNNEEKL